MVLIGLVGLLLVDPFPQDPGYHLFADTRSLFGIPGFMNVVSNGGFTLVGILGIAIVAGRKRYLIFSAPRHARPYLVFFVGVALVSLGSAYYHWEPDNDRLLWDRLPMSITFMAFTSAIIADRIHANTGNGWLLAVLIVLGISSLLYWDYTEQQQQGDLRFYSFIQFAPIILMPFILWLFPRHRYVKGRYIGWIIAWYLLSKILEYLDAEVFAMLGHLVSGHTLKHLAAAIGSLVVLRMLMSRLESDS